jgi:protein tyrosine phosphatase (PTP) superfamily phosphohydrolase (DUF442 family)
MRSFLIFAACTFSAIGCCKDKCCSTNPPKPYLPPPPSGPILLPPAGVPTAPVQSPPPMIPSVGPAGGQFPPPVIPTPPGTSSFKPAPEVLFPDPLPAGPSSRISSPPIDQGLAVAQSPAKPTETVEPPIAAAKMTGLLSFRELRDGLASGRKPTLDGIASLKQASYRTVIYLHPAGTDVSAIRELVEKRGLAFVGIETTPEKLTKALEAFNAAIADRTRPAYVFDEDGVRAGAMWYLYFRSQSHNDDAARVMAKSLGLSDEGEEGKAFELAIQKYLSER